MSTKHIFWGVFRGGRFIPEDAPAFSIKASKLEGVRVKATFTKPGVKASASQHGFYRATVLPTIAEWAGYDASDERELDKIHTALKLRVFGYEDKWGLQVVKSHADYDVEQFSEFLEKVLRWTAEAGLYIPEASGGTE